MAFSEALAERIRQGLARRKNIEEKKMIGGIGFLLNGEPARQRQKGLPAGSPRPGAER
jgi:hypothetical protein